MSGAHRGLLAWQKAMQLVTEIYRNTTSFPQTEIYGLTRQLRAAAVSVPSNIAEGKGRLSKKEYVMFLGRARGSLLEVETQVEIAFNLEFLTEERFAFLRGRVEETGRVLNGLIKKTKSQYEEEPEG